MNFTSEYIGKPDGSKLFTTATETPSGKVLLGTRAIDRFGRSYRYVKAGAVDLVAGDCIQSPAIVANHLANTPPAVALGATSFVYTPGATLGAASLYKQGFLQVDTTPGQGRMYGVRDHDAFASATAFTLFLETDDPIAVALTTSSRVGLIKNPYDGVIQMPVTTATGILVGVAVSAIPAGGFGWIQTWGYAAVLINGTPALGATVVSPSATTAGAVDVITTTNLVTAQIVGRMGQVGVSTKNNAVFLTINP
jgi:hypothetical protein